MSDSFRRLIIAQEEHFVHGTPGTYPRLCRLSDGSILVGFTAFENGLRILSVARSTDGARTFEPHGEVTRSSGDCDNLFLLELPRDEDPEIDDEIDSINSPPTILAAFRKHDRASDGTYTYFRLVVCQSTDGGRSWFFLSIPFEKHAPFGLWEPFLLHECTTSALQLYFSQEMDHDDQDIMVVCSTDGGATWSSPQCVTGDGERLRDGMVGVALTRDTFDDLEVEALVMVMETTRHGTLSIEAAVSYDWGETFGWRQAVYKAREGRNAGAPQIVAFTDRSLAVVFMTDEDEDGESTWPRGAKVKAIFDLGLHLGTFDWGEPDTITETASSWPGILRVADDAAMAVYESSSSIRGRMLRVELWEW
ncbi:glycoside hydrolase [Chaetomidium leptoderma]|uniref:Glycoside hydrolase n=1 Tax=Chaetomidium leptoderma TaxID=669021 RepID=A0AAN6VNF9_9PEZI|nr:glycoside hydrolase [Chaetomidium leptoderma]